MPAISRRSPLLLILGLLLLAFVLSSALAAANTFPQGQSSAGEGAETVSGYAITDISYALDVADPTQVDEVSFVATKDAAAAAIAGADLSIRVRLEAGGAFFTCTATGPTGDDYAVTCAAVAQDIDPIDTFEVVIVQSP